MGQTRSMCTSGWATAAIAVSYGVGRWAAPRVAASAAG